MVLFCSVLGISPKPINGDVNINDERLRSLNYDRQSWSSISDVSYACHIYCTTEQSGIMVILEDQWHSHLDSGAVTTCFKILARSLLRFEHPPVSTQGERTNRVRHHRGSTNEILNELLSFHWIYFVCFSRWNRHVFMLHIVFTHWFTMV